MLPCTQPRCAPRLRARREQCRRGVSTCFGMIDRIDFAVVDRMAASFLGDPTLDDFGSATGRTPAHKTRDGRDGQNGSGQHLLAKGVERDNAQSRAKFSEGDSATRTASETVCPILRSHEILRTYRTALTIGDLTLRISPRVPSPGRANRPCTTCLWRASRRLCTRRAGLVWH